MAETDGSDKVLVELFIHQSPFDRRRLVAVDEEPLNKGAGNPIDEQWKLCFTILAEKGYLDLLITNIDPNSPPPFFKVNFQFDFVTISAKVYKGKMYEHVNV